MTQSIFTRATATVGPLQFVFLLALVSPALAALPDTYAGPALPEDLAWNSWHDALAKAHAQDKPILLLAVHSGCPHSKELSRSLLYSEDFADFSRHFVLAALGDEAEHESLLGDDVELMQPDGVYYPRMVFISPGYKVMPVTNQPVPEPFPMEPLHHRYFYHTEEGAVAAMHRAMDAAQALAATRPAHPIPSDYAGPSIAPGAVEWLNWKAALHVSAVTRKPLMLVAVKPGCALSERLVRGISASIEVEHLSRHFVMALVSAEPPVHTDQYGVIAPDGFYAPRVVFINVKYADGSVMSPMAVYTTATPERGAKYKYFAENVPQLVGMMRRAAFLAAHPKTHNDDAGADASEQKPADAAQVVVRSDDADVAAKPLLSMTKADVAALLRALGIEEYAPKFKRTDGKLLAVITKEDLRLRFGDDHEAVDVLWVFLEAARLDQDAAAAAEHRTQHATQQHMAAAAETEADDDLMPNFYALPEKKVKEAPRLDAHEAKTHEEATITKAANRLADTYEKPVVAFIGPEHKAVEVPVKKVPTTIVTDASAPTSGATAEDGKKTKKVVRRVVRRKKAVPSDTKPDATTKKESA